jgi:hypothetical protein
MHSHAPDPITTLSQLPQENIFYVTVIIFIFKNVLYKEWLLSPFSWNCEKCVESESHGRIKIMWLRNTAFNKEKVLSWFTIGSFADADDFLPYLDPDPDLNKFSANFFSGNIFDENML